MTPARRRIAMIAGYVALLVAAFVLSWMFGAGRFREDAGARAEEQARTVLLSVRELRERKPQIDAGLEAFVDRSLGDSLPKVDAEVRARLNQLGAEEKLGQLVVNTGATAARESPAKSRYGRGADQKALRDEIDFVEVSGSISGEGAPENIFRLLQRIEEEPWLKRVDSVRLDVVGGRRGAEEPRLRAVIRFTTPFLPGRTPQRVLASSWSPASLERLSPILDALPFAMPRPATTPEDVATPAREAPSPPTAPALFAYQDWVLSGVARGARGAEAWLLNRGSGESRVLHPGDALHEMTLAEAEGERAVFTLGGERLAVAVGTPLSERQRVE